MEVVVTTGVIKHAMLPSNLYHQHINTHIFTDWMPFLWPNQKHKSTEGNIWNLEHLEFLK